MSDLSPRYATFTQIICYTLEAKQEREDRVIPPEAEMYKKAIPAANWSRYCNGESFIQIDIVAGFCFFSGIDLIDVLSEVEIRVSQMEALGFNVSYYGRKSHIIDDGGVLLDKDSVWALLDKEDLDAGNY